MRITFFFGAKSSARHSFSRPISGFDLPKDNGRRHTLHFFIKAKLLMADFDHRITKGAVVYVNFSKGQFDVCCLLYVEVAEKGGTCFYLLSPGSCVICPSVVASAP